ncbi:hypothetical protein PM076_14720 [Halorubrum ezzemoulense]|uniref:hypothetical protein n=1 Tax=Halorubrum ezzemoulense TaxID=337243 RepID=UPI00232F0234|nr:hypothetical protein [Halorubrum ezzemoulense]MDB2245212.1 hypothetical protein [Halorubrum ezzemoulense]MDB2290068.1 hypothetical protein [Halorubrum ezzemoulense]MDB2297538.1 hypothetical protein [Halorubrum ezzemoulense]MDB2301118.1 hypothetical protein [Halorubrum ezzemoulense]
MGGLVTIIVGVIIGDQFDIRRLELIWVEALAFVDEILHTHWDAPIVAELVHSFFTSQAWPLVVFVVVLVPCMTVFDRELSMPYPVGWLVHLVDVDVTALTQRDHVLDTLIRIVAVDVMEGEFVLVARSEIGFKPFLWRSTADHALLAPTVEDCLFKMCWSH